MAGDPMRRVQPGDRLEIPAAAWNELLDTRDAFRAAERRQGGGAINKSILPPGLVYVKNGSGSAVERFGVLGIDSVIVSPTDSADGFAETVGLVGITPTSDHVAGRFLVCLEPIAAGSIGIAIAGGVTVAKVDVDDAAHAFAAAEAGNVGALLAAESGAAQVLWKESGTGNGKWAVIRFGSAGDALPASDKQYQVIINTADDADPVDWQAGFVAAHNSPAS